MSNNQLAKIKAMYEDNVANEKLHALIIGDKGVGKTHLGKTCPLPLLVYSFDPGGSQTLKEEIDNGDVFVAPFEYDDVTNPSCYASFRKMFNEHRKTGFFDNFATVMLDSLSTLADALVLEVLKQENRKLPSVEGGNAGDGMRIQDWMTVSNEMSNLVRSFQLLPVHTLMLGHIDRERDEASGQFLKSLSFPGKSSLRIPQLSSDVYYLMAKGNDEKITRHLQVLNNGEYHAGSRLPNLEAKEEPDIKKLLEKAGLDASDKPKLEIE